MYEKGSSCKAILKKGTPCPNPGKAEYRGYGGRHRLQVATHEPIPINDQRLALLLGAGAALVEITSKAIEYFPQLIEAVLNASQVALTRGSQRGLDEAKLNKPIIAEDFPGLVGIKKFTLISDGFSRGRETRKVAFKLMPKMIPQDISRYVKDNDWQRLADFLGNEFQAMVLAAKLKQAPERRDALHEIESKGDALLDLLSQFGYRCRIPSYQRFEFWKILD